MYNLSFNNGNQIQASTPPYSRFFTNLIAFNTEQQAWELVGSSHQVIGRTQKRFIICILVKTGSEHDKTDAQYDWLVELQTQS